MNLAELIVAAEPAERAVVSRALVDPSIPGWLDLDEGDISSLPLRSTWSAMVALHGAGSAIDSITLEAELRRRGVLEAVGGLAWISLLAVAAPAGHAVEHHAELVRQAAATRRVLAVGDELADAHRRGIVGDDLIDLATRLVARADRPRAEVRTLADFIEDEQRAIADPATDAPASIATGISILDRFVGGLPIGVPTILAARPSVGKSALALHIAICVAQRAPVLLLTAEDSPRTMAQRAIAASTVTDLAKLRVRELTGGARRMIAGVDARAMKLDRLEIVPVHGRPMLEVARLIRAAAARGAQLAIYDYLQLCPRPRGFDGTKNDQVEANMLVFTEVVGELEIAGLMLSQLNRKCEVEKRRPELADLRDSGSLEQAAKLVLMLFADPDRPAELEIIIRKQSQGPRDLRAIVGFDRPTCRVTDATPLRRTGGERRDP